MLLKYLIIVVIIKIVKCKEILNFNNYRTEAKILELITAIGQSYDIRTIFIKYNETLANCGELDAFVKQLNGTIIIENLQKSWLLRESLNSNILSLVCLKQLSTNNYESELRPYFYSLRSIRETKMIFFINDNESVHNLGELENFLKYCWQRKSLNVIVIFKDFYRTLYLYAYKAFPHFEMIRKYMHKVINEEIYPNHLKNSMGHDFYTLPDQIIPRTFLIATSNGGVKISGYVGHFLHLFAERLNVTLKFPFPIKKGEVLFYGYLETLTRNYTIDLPGTLAPIIDAQQMLYYSYPFQIINACLMIPVAKNMPLREVFFYLVNFEMSSISILNLYLFTILLNLKRHNVCHRQCKRKLQIPLPDFILNDVALRGILGQPFNVWRKAGFFTKFIYILLSLAGLYLSLVYGAFLQTFFTRPFKERQLRTFEDLFQNNVITLLSYNEVNYFKDADLNFRLLYRITTYDEFNHMRSGLNTSYAYPTTNMHWYTLFNTQQNIFKEKFFIFSENACIFTNVLMSFPMAENSIYRHALHKILASARDYGLINRWLRSNYLDLQADGKSRSQYNLTMESKDGRTLEVQDYQLVFFMYVGLMIVASLTFLGEKIHFRWRKLLTNRRRK